jgi:hypothetical protein
VTEDESDKKTTKRGKGRKERNKKETREGQDDGRPASRPTFNARWEDYMLEDICSGPVTNASHSRMALCHSRILYTNFAFASGAYASQEFFVKFLSYLL